MAVCTAHVECAQHVCANNKDGECIALVECLSKKDRACPFFKTKEQAAEEIAACIERMTRIRANAKKTK